MKQMKNQVLACLVAAVTCFSTIASSVPAFATEAPEAAVSASTVVEATDTATVSEVPTEPVVEEQVQTVEEVTAEQQTEGEAAQPVEETQPAAEVQSTETPAPEAQPAPETPPTGKLFIHLQSENGEVKIGENENAVTIRKIEEKKAVIKNAAGEETEVQLDDDGNYLVREDVIGTEISTSAKGDEGFLIATYRITYDTGDEEEAELPDYSSEFEQKVTITTEKNTLYVGFVSEEDYVPANAEVMEAEAEAEEISEEIPEETTEMTEAEESAEDVVDTEDAVIEEETETEATSAETNEETKESGEDESSENDAKEEVSKNEQDEVNPSDAARLIIKTENTDVIDENKVIGQIDGTYLLQFKSAEEAAIAKEQYIASAEYVADDLMVLASDDEYIIPNEWTAEEIAMSDNENPFTETENANPIQMSGANLIALIDTGVSDNPNVIQKLSVLGDDPIDHNGHGDAMLGKILEQNDKASVISIKALDDNGVGSISSLYAGIRLAIDSGAQIISLSLSANSPKNEALEEIINEAVGKGIIVVAAAGDRAVDVANCIPAGISGVMAVGTCDSNGAKLPKSNFGDNVKYNVVTTSSSYAAATMAGHLSAHGLQVEPDNEIIFPSDFEPETDESLGVTEQYIVAHMDKSLVGDGTPVPVRCLRVKQTLVDGRYVGAGETIDSIMSMPNDDFEKLQKIIAMFPTEVMVYEISPDSAYYVAYANTMMNDVSARVQDWAFAENNFDGIAVDAIYNQGNGLAYLPKSLFNSEILDPIQIQLLQVIGDWQSETSSTVVALEADGVDTPVSVDQSRIFDLETTVQAIPTEMIGEVSDKDVLVKMNGIPVDEQYYSLNNATGELTIGVPSAMAGTVSVEVEEPTVIEKIKEALLPVEVEAASRIAALMEFANDTAHPLVISADTVTGTSFRGTTDIKYGFNVGGGSGMPYYYYDYDGSTVFYDIYQNKGFSQDPMRWESSLGFNYVINLDTIELKDTNGNLVDFRDMGIKNFGMACMHIKHGVDADKGNPINYYEGIPAVSGGVSSATVPVMGRFMEVDWGENTAIIGVMTGQMNGQTGFTLIKAHIKPEGAYLKLNKRSSDMIPLEYQLHLNQVGDETGFHNYGTGRRTSVRIESLQIKKPTVDQNGNPLPAGEIQFKVHQQNLGDVGPATGLESGQYSDTWVTATTDGSARAGLIGNRKRVEGIMVQLTGELANQYDVVYTVHTSIDNEQLKTAKNGELAGTRGESLGLVDVDSIVLVKKNTAINMNGAQYGIYRSQAAADAAKPGNSGSPIATITVNQYGATNWVKVQETGDYWFKEIKVPAGYEADEESHKVTINKMGETAGTVSVDRHGAPPPELYKESANPGITNGNSKYSLAGAIYGIYRTKAEADAATDKKQGSPIEKITTDANGKAVAKSTEYQVGSTYYAKELVPSNNFQLDQNTIAVKIESYNTPARFVSKEVPITKLVKLKKVSSNTTITTNNSCYSLAGAKYGIYDTEAKAKAATKQNPGSPIEILTTDANGNANGTVNSYVIGRTYYAKELEPSKGYRLDKEVRTVTIAETGDNVFTSIEEPFADPTPLGIRKISSEGVKYNDPLEGAQFTIKYYDATNASGTAKATWTIETDEFNNATLDESHLKQGTLYKNANGKPVIPIGTITMQETKAPDGWNKLDTIFVGHITQDGETTKIAWDNGTVDGDRLVVEHTATIPNTPKRVDIVLTKTKEDGTPMAGIPFLISRDGSDEAHIVVTDKNGKIDTAALLKAANKDKNKVNKLDDQNNGGVFRNESKLDATNAVWFGNIDSLDTKGAFVTGSYKILELQCKANFEYDLVDETFAVTDTNGVTNVSNATLTDGKWALKTIVNKFITMQTTAVDKNTNLKIVPESGEVILEDTVTYKGLKPDRTYIMKGRLVNSENTDEIIATSEKEFIPQNSEGIVKLEFKFDAKELDGRNFVVFESLFWGSINEKNHENPKDKDQTVFIPKIGTTAVDSQTGDTTAAKGPESKILDEVQFSGLQVGNKYRIVGTLMDKATNEPMKDAAGEIITQYTDFEYSAEAGDEITGEYEEGEKETNKTFQGKRTLEFTVDSTGFEDQTTVVFETLYVFGPAEEGQEPQLIQEDGKDREYANHKDITDEGQTIRFIDLKTTALDKSTVSHVGVAPETAEQANGQAVTDTIVDTVHLKNLVYGKTYTVRGILVDQNASAAESAEAPVYIKNLDGNNVTAELTFTADETMLENMVVKDSDKAVPAPTATSDTETQEGTETGETGETGEPQGEGTQTGEGGETEQPAQPEQPAINYGEYGVRAVDGDIKLEFVVDNPYIQGKPIVVFEDLYHNDIKVVSHCDITDKSQVIYPPTLKTNATDNMDGMHQALATEKVEITDDVYFEGLLAGKEYTIDGQLVYQKDFTDANGVTHKAGEPLADEGAKASVTFVAGTPAPAEDNTDTAATDGTQTEDGNTEEGQTQETGDGQTTDTGDAQTGDTQTQEGDTTDTTDGTEQSGTSETGETPAEGTEQTTTEDGEIAEPAEEQTVNTPDMHDVVETELPDGQRIVKGYVKLHFVIDASALEGQTIVAFEDLKSDGTTVFTHKNLNDTPQTIRIPKIRTTAKTEEIDEATLYDENGNYKNITIVDTIQYENLWSLDDVTRLHNEGINILPDDGRNVYDINETTKYIAKGVLMDKETGESLKDKDGKEYIAYSEPFMPESANGSVDVTFTVNPKDLIKEGKTESELEGKTLVVFETLFRADSKEEIKEDRPVAEHKDIKDNEQDVRITRGRTHATDATSDVQASGLTKDEIAKLEAEHDSSKTSTPHEVYASDEMTVVDRLTYTNLHGNTKYTATGVLMIKNTDADGNVTAEPATDDSGNPITKEVEFVTAGSYDDNVNGYVDIQFTFSGLKLQGKTLVAFEKVTRDGKDIIIHADINDNPQTIFVPKIGTSASDAITGTHEGVYGTNTYIIDVVSYENLEKGKQYALSAFLKDKADGSDIKGTTVIGLFTAGEDTQCITPDGTVITTMEKIRADISNGNKVSGTARPKVTKEEGVSATSKMMNRVSGEVYVVIPVDSSALNGHTVVAFERLYAETNNGEAKIVAHHEELTDEEQSVTYPDLHTEATVNGQHAAIIGPNTTLTDTVSYKALETGREYILRGILMNKQTGKPLLINEKEVTATQKFTAQKPDGEEKMNFVFDSSALNGVTVVVYEDLYTRNDKGDLIRVGTHRDINDEKQSVLFSTQPQGGGIQTSDNPVSPIIPIIAGGALAAIIIILIIKKRRDAE